MRPNHLQQIWKKKQTAINAWLTIPSAWVAEVTAHAGFDALTIDMQHGLADYQATVSMIQAISATDVVPMVRAPWNEPSIIMRMLDAGAWGVICPMVNTREQAEAFVGACRYPPAGYRSYGPIRTGLYAGDDYLAQANDSILTLAQIETAEALENLDEILSVKGLNGVYVGTMDLSISLGVAPAGDLRISELRAALQQIARRAQQRGLVAGVHARTPGESALLAGWGYGLLTTFFDTIALQDAARSAVQARSGGMLRKRPGKPRRRKK
ncbi:MAG: HpcH/HpaI aldolase family protein [Terriglobales bacterium]